MTRNPFARIARPRWKVSILVTLFFVLGIVGAQGIVRASAPRQVDPTPQPAGIDADALRDFEEELAAAFVENEGEALVEMAVDDFRYATWAGDRRVLGAAAAVAVMQESLLDDAVAPFYLEEMGLSDIEAIVGQDPLTLWGEDLPVVSVLMVTGLADTGAGEALLAIAPNAEGAPEWVGLLEAVDGLPAAPAPGENDENTGVIEGTEDTENGTEESDAEGAEGATSGDEATIAIETPPVVIELGALPAVAQYTGVANGGPPARYQLPVRLGETLTVDLSSTGEAAFTVTGALNGQPYKGAENGALTWTHLVPATQEYVIEVTASEPVTYVLSLLLSPLGHRLVVAESQNTEDTENGTEESVGEGFEVSEEGVSDTPEEQAPEVVVTPEATPQPMQRVRFGPGESSTTRSGSVVLGGEAEYLLRINAGQTLNASIVSDGDLANFSITGVTDGQPYKRVAGESRSFSMALPTTQDYSIVVLTGESSPVDYTLFLDVPPAPVPTPTPIAIHPPITPVENPTRVQFSAGQTATSFTELVGAYGSDGYVLEAVAGQQMFVSIASPENIARFSVSVWETGQVLKPADGQTNWSGVLPVSGDYLVQVENDRPVRVQYTLEIAFSPLSGGGGNPQPAPEPTPVPQQPAQRITFPPGAISASVSGFVTANEVQSYVLAANAGQTMTAVLSSASGDVGLSIVGEDGTPFKRSSVGGTGFTFVLPLTQDYYVSAVGGGTDSSYDLSVIIVN